MNRDLLVEEIDRLMQMLGTLEPTSAEYERIERCLWGTGGKGGTTGLVGMLLAIDGFAHEVNKDDENFEIEKSKIMADLTKSLEQQKAEAVKSTNEARKLDIEEQRLRDEREANEQKIKVEQFKAETEAREVEQRAHMTKAEAKARRREIGLKGLVLGGVVLLTAGAQSGGILDKNLVSLWPKTI